MSSSPGHEQAVTVLLWVLPLGSPIGLCRVTEERTQQCSRPGEMGSCHPVLSKRSTKAEKNEIPKFLNSSAIL